VRREADLRMRLIAERLTNSLRKDAPAPSNATLKMLTGRAPSRRTTGAVIRRYRRAGRGG
jgi:hypothetical protein